MKIALANSWRLLRGLVVGLTVAAASPPPAIGRPAPTPPGAAARADAPGLDGIWKGQLNVPGGQLEISFRFIKLAGGDYFATLDVPQQKVNRLVVKTELRGDTLRLFAEEASSRFVGRVSADGQQLTGTWYQPGFQVPLVLAFSALPTSRTAKTRLTPPYREAEATFRNEAAQAALQGMLTVPAGAGPFPAVVLLSDVGAHDRDGTVGDFAPLGLLADYLTRRGVAVLRFDDRGAGQSTGAAAQAPAELVSDAQAALNYLRTRPEIDLTRLGLIGHGEGGNVALLAAGQPLPPAFVITLAASGLPGRDMVLQQQAITLRTLGSDAAQVEAATKRERALLDIIRLTPDDAQAQAIVANMLRQNNRAIDNATAQSSAAEMTSPRYRALLAFDPAAKLAAVNCPVLLLSGTADLTLDADANLGALKKGLNHNKKVTAKKLPGVNHLFQPDPAKWPMLNGQPQPNFSPEAEEAIREWILTQVK